MKAKGKIMGVLATLAIMLSAMSMTAAANPMAATVDYSNPFSNMWVIFAFLAAIVGALLIFMAVSMKGEKKAQQTTWGIVSMIVAAALFMVAVYVPDGGDTLVVVTDTGTTAYDLIVNPANNTVLGHDYVDRYTWGDVEVNMTANTIANGTGELTFNITISRQSGAVDDHVRCYITEASISESDLGYMVIAKSSGVYQITWTDVAGTAVTGLNKMPLAFPGASENSAKFVTCAVTLSDQAMNNLADNNVESAHFTMYFESDAFGVIGSIPVTIYGNYWA
jgi:hypothetical protein